jgi:hypothetical protein
MNKPERKHFMSDAAFLEALRSYEKHQEYVMHLHHVVKTISGPADIWVHMEKHCQKIGSTKSGFIFEAIKEKLERS